MSKGFVRPSFWFISFGIKSLSFKAGNQNFLKISPQVRDLSCKKNIICLSKVILGLSNVVKILLIQIQIKKGQGNYIKDR